MAKLTGAATKIFAGGIEATNVVSEFGSLKAGAVAYSSDPDHIQSLDAWYEGFSSAVITNNFMPTIQDMNALYYVVTRQLACHRQHGILRYNAAQTYYIGSTVSDGIGGIYKSVTDGNVGHALTDAAEWFQYYSIKQTDIGDNYAVTNLDYNIRWSLAVTSAGHHTVTLPIPTAALTGRMYLVKVILSVDPAVEVVVADGSAINNYTNPIMQYLTRYQTGHYMCDGVKWWALNVHGPYG